MPRKFTIPPTIHDAILRIMVLTRTQSTPANNAKLQAIATQEFRELGLEGALTVAAFDKTSSAIELQIAAIIASLRHALTTGVETRAALIAAGDRPPKKRHFHRRKAKKAG